jgi:AAA15 family ATPase/GTPase
MIAEDETNQFFLVTHNPYFLETLINISNKHDIIINYVYMEQFQTNVKQLSEQELYDLRKGDIFYNLQHLME